VCTQVGKYSTSPCGMAVVAERAVEDGPDPGQE
jgi:hypothetical protein